MTRHPQDAEFVVAWLYRAKPDRQREFEQVYGSDGAWAALFRLEEGYLGTDLHGDGESYLVVDRWRSRGAHERFHLAFAEEYAALSTESEALYREETRIGAFSRVAPAAEGTNA